MLILRTLYCDTAKLILLLTIFTGAFSIVHAVINTPDLWIGVLCIIGLFVIVSLLTMGFKYIFNYHFEKVTKSELREANNVIIILMGTVLYELVVFYFIR